MTWDFNTFGDYIDYTWWEDDPDNNEGTKVSYTNTYNGTTAKVEFEIGNSDDNMGHKIVTRFEKETAIYDTGLIKWQMKFNN